MSDVISIGKLIYDPEQRTLTTLDGSKTRTLSEQTSKLLDMFLSTHAILTHKEIEDALASETSTQFPGFAAHHVHKLRTAIDKEAHRIVSCRGVGYRWSLAAKPRAAYGAGKSQIATILEASIVPMSSADILRELPKLGMTRIESALSSLRRERRLVRHGGRRSATYTLKKD